MKSQKQLQVGESIKRIMSEIFIREDMLNTSGSYVTIAEADVSPDMKNVKIYVNIFGDQNKQQNIINKLNQSSPHFRFKLAKKIHLRLVPEISFLLDGTEEKAVVIDKIMLEERRKMDNINKKTK